MSADDDTWDPMSIDMSASPTCLSMYSNEYNSYDESEL
jgi:hypothetical protein